MLVFRRPLEHGRYLTETYNFIGDEIRYAAQMVAHFERLGHRDEPDQLFVHSARRYLDSLDAAYSAAREAAMQRGPRTVTEGLLHKFFLNTFPDLIRDLTTALFQRNEAQPPRMVRAPHAGVPFAPSEVTLEYPITIRAAEVLNEDYHSRVVHFYDRKYSAPPLVNLSGSTAASLQLREPLAAAVADTEMRGKRPSMLERNELTTRHLLNLSCITLPRWSSQHVRTYAFAAHEHMHRALARVHMLVRGAARAYYDAHKEADLHLDWRSPDTALKDRAIAAVGVYTAPFGASEHDIPIGPLFEHTYALFQRLWDFFQRRKLRYIAEEAEKPNIHRMWVKELRRVAWDHTIELLADAGALVIAGPAFAFAYRTVFTPNTARDLEHLDERVTLDTPRHPPALLRAHLHAVWLRELGFFDISKMLLTACEEEWTIAKTAKHADLLAAYASFVSNELADNFKRALDLVGGIGGPESYDLRKRSGNPPVATADPAVEQRLLKRWEGIARRVEIERKYFVADMSAAVFDEEPAMAITPADAINAIWWKRIREGTEDPKNRLAWRVALRNSYGSVRNRER